MSAPRVTVIVVSYNTIDKLRRCLGCIERHHEIIVVDNRSGDGSADMVRSEYPHVHLVANQENAGFGAANNQGLELATGSLALFLNSDAYADPGAIDLLADSFSDPAIAAAGGMLVNPDGSLQESVAAPLSLGMVFLEQTFIDRLARRFGHGYWRTKPVRQKIVDQVMGACLMMRHPNGIRFDERFFLYCEDTDLCLRLQALGHILYVPDARFVHDLGSSSSGSPWLGVIRYNHGKELYFRIHYGRLAAIACWLLNRFGALLRLLLWLGIGLVRPAKRLQIVLFWRVVTSKR